MVQKGKADETDIFHNRGNRGEFGKLSSGMADGSLYGGSRAVRSGTGGRMLESGETASTASFSELHLDLSVSRSLGSGQDL